MGRDSAAHMNKTMGDVYVQVGRMKGVLDLEEVAPLGLLLIFDRKVKGII